MKWVARIVQGVLCVGFLMSGLTKLFSGLEQIREMYSDPLGYDPVFIYAIGAIETSAALALIAGFRWKRAAAAASVALAVVMVGAIASQLTASAPADAVLPAVYLILLVFLLVRLIRAEGAWKLRSTQRA
ncbi:DoxX family protein [Cohnella caldifontis]|uniref:DoxX family protein n=1 Tax=Cohnella caldifontis TaxID=3027471 RepID=UPI0023EE0787|nr:DoxX family protein [Cohnella sp. YIM B05605]